MFLNLPQSSHWDSLQGLVWNAIESELLAVKSPMKYCVADPLFGPYIPEILR